MVRLLIVGPQRASFFGKEADIDERCKKDLDIRPALHYG